MRQGPLSGVRVLDLSRFMAGPYAGQLLAYLGAEVIKLEDPGVGDPMREVSKYYEQGLSAHFIAGNASKKSITLNLRSEVGKNVFLALAKKADVVIENFRPGVMEKLGITYQQLAEVNSRIILASITGFGQFGPLRERASYDLIAQAAGGGMSITGWPNEAPAKMGVPIGDLGAGIYATLGIVAALYGRTRSGEGERIDVSMLDAQLSLLNYHAHFYWISGEEPVPEGDGHPNLAPYQSFQTETGPLVVAVYGDSFWPGFCRATECLDLLHDVRFATNSARLTNKAELIRLLTKRLASDSRERLLERLVAEKVPATFLHSVGEAVDSAHARARSMVLTVQGPEGRPMKLLGNPIKLANNNVVPQAPPRLGEHTEIVLEDWLGYTESDISKLRSVSAI